MKKVRFFSLMTALFIVIATFAGCDSGSTGTTTTPTPQATEGETEAPAKESEQSQTPTVINPGGDIHLQMSTWWGGDTVAAFQSVIDEFTADNADVSVELMVWPWNEYPDKMITAYAGGATPDILMMDQTRDFQQYYFAGVLEPMDSYIAAEGYSTDSWIDGLIESHTYEGKLVGVPVHREQLITWWNVDLFNQAGLPGLSEQPTWDEIWEAAEAIYNLPDDAEGRKIYGMGAPHYSQLAYTFDLGLDFELPDGTVVFNTPERIAAADVMLGYIEKYGPPENPEFDPFQAGVVGMVVGNWYGTPNEVGGSLPFENRITNFPISKASDSQIVWTCCNSLGLASTSQNKDTAFKLITYYGSEKGDMLLSKYTLSPRIGEARTLLETPKDDFPYDAGAIIATQGDARVTTLPKAPWVSAMQKVLQLQGITKNAGEITTQEYYDEAQYAVDDWLMSHG